MKFKIDENLPAEVAEQLRELGHEASTVVQEVLTGAPDSAIVAAAAAEARILLTLDKGIANLLRHPTATNHGVVLFRPGSVRYSNSSASVSRLCLVSPWMARSPWSQNAGSDPDSEPADCAYRKLRPI